MNRVHFRAAVYLKVRDSEGNVLLHRRANTGYLDEYYDFPSGHVEVGESFSEAAVRELAEEVGIVADESDLRMCHLSQNYSNDTPYVLVIFDVLKWSGVPMVCEPDKCDDIQFFPIDRLPDRCTLGVRLIERVGFDAPVSLSRVMPEEFDALVMHRAQIG